MNPSEISVVDSLWQELVQGFSDDKDCTNEIANLAWRNRDRDGANSVVNCDSLLEDLMGDCGKCEMTANDLDDFSELMRAPLETGSTLDTFSGLVKAPVQLAPWQSPEEKALATVKSADIPPVFRIPVMSRPPVPLQVPKRPTLTVPSLAKAASCGSLVHSGGCERSFQAHEVGLGLVARVAPVVSAFTLVPLMPFKVSHSSDAADRARQVACKQQRLYARQKLDAKRLRCKKAAATLAQVNAARSSDKKLSKYPKRQQAANGRSRTGGKFQKENKGVFLPASQL